LVINSSTRMWLGSATLAGLLLASTLSASATTQTQTATATAMKVSTMKPVLIASSSVPSKTYTETVRKQMQWAVIVPAKVEIDAVLEKLSPTSSEPVAVAVQPSQPVKVVATVKPVKADKALPAKGATAQPAVSNTKPVQVAAAPQQQVSRSDSSTLVDNALSLVGVPYHFGGTSRSGFDCSGFVQYVYKGSEIKLPRTSQSQFTVGSAVSKEQIQAGDLVFFTTYTAGASHVGISIGGGKFVHASNSGVRVSSLNESYYNGRYYGARRVD